MFFSQYYCHRTDGDMYFSSISVIGQTETLGLSVTEKEPYKLGNLDHSVEHWSLGTQYHIYWHRAGIAIERDKHRT